MKRPKLTLLQLLKYIGFINLLIGLTGLFMRFGLGYTVDTFSIILSFVAGFVCLILVRLKTA